MSWKRAFTRSAISSRRESTEPALMNSDSHLLLARHLHGGKVAVVSIRPSTAFDIPCTPLGHENTADTSFQAASHVMTVAGTSTLRASNVKSAPSASRNSACIMSEKSPLPSRSQHISPHRHRQPPSPLSGWRLPGRLRLSRKGEARTHIRSPRGNGKACTLALPRPSPISIPEWPPLK